MTDQPEDLTPIPHMDSEPRSAPTRAPRSQSGCFTALTGAAGCLALVVVILIAAIVLGVTSFSAVINGVGGLFGVGGSAPPPVAGVISSQTIVQGIQPLGQLVSVSAQLAKADVFVGIGQGALNACGFDANHVVQGAVEAGIDLTQISADDMVYNSAREVYVLTVPAPQLTSCRVDYIRQYDRSFTTCSVDWDEARLLASYTSLIEFRDDSIEGGILTRAEAETRLVLSNFVRLLTGYSVEVVFEPSTEPTVYPPSCDPEVPQGWRFDAANGHWTK